MKFYEEISSALQQKENENQELKEKNQNQCE